MMPTFSERELAILEKLWENHGYYLDKTFAYCQPLIIWAINESKYTLTRQRIKVRSTKIDNYVLTLMDVGIPKESTTSQENTLREVALNGASMRDATSSTSNKESWD